MRDAKDSPRDVAPDPMIGRQVRDLRILERIGRGGMGAVYKVEHVLLREIRALKMIRAERFGAVPQALERFQREARIAVRLRHPNLVLVYDFFIEGGNQFLVMEYVVGESLAARIREHGALSIDETCSIGIQCCAGLAYAHDMGIVHRDLSPENILLRPGPDESRVKIIDFGIARAAVSESGVTLAGEEGTLTRVGDFLGKPRYASPEQAGKLRAGETLDPRSDLYTLGLILYEMATGDLPFHSDTEIGYLSLHAFEPPPPPTRVRPDLPIPSALEQVILRCLEKNRAQRFPDARALAAALEWAWHSGDPKQAPFPIAPQTDSQKTRLFDSVDNTQWREAAQEPSAPQESGEVAREGASGIAPLVGLALLAGVSAGVAVWWWTGSRTPPAQEPPGLIASAPSEGEPARLPPVEPRPAQATEPPAKTEAEPAEPPPKPQPVEPKAALPTEPVAKAQAGPVEPPPKPQPAAATTSSKEPSSTAQVPTTPEHAATPSAASAPVVPRLASNAPKPPKARPPSSAPATAGVSPFAGEAEMRQSFDEAVRFEESHDAASAIESWKRFRGRGPTRELDEEAKRHITRLTLAGLKDVR